MRKTIFIIIGLLFCLSGFETKAQNQFDPNDYVYWFYLRTEKKLDRNLNQNVYLVRTLSKTPKYGTFAAYEKDTWRCLLGGQQMVIGPFRQFKVAKQALAIYDMAKLPEEQRKIQIAKLSEEIGLEHDEYFCYYLKYDVSKRTKKFVLRRVPARTSIDGITLDGFIDQFLEGLTFEMLAIGPFFDRPEAEESKRLNRLEEK
jgi:hypothetical protein